MELTPALLFVMWGAGVAAGSALVASWRVVGPGYLWLAGGVAAGLAALAALAGGGALAWAAAVLAFGGVLAAKRDLGAMALFAASSGVLLMAGYEPGALAVSLLFSGTVLLGAITSEMLLGHWFLVDPTLPRRSLLRLDAVSGAGLLVDAGLIVASGSLALSAMDGILTAVWAALVAFGGLLIIGVWFSLREPQYSGVMAATGLSYLAVLVAFGIVAAGRSLVGGGL
ncbi:MAG: hypothetical protein BMS9Abin07_1611 [Acidimicrobiia bacterium]|nr:MAG: hypothetical protein BMS9Abin07_1611 [Acidimicrobiia bacterium]